ncbi:type II toxin-antitoxin system HicB family antitoxin [Candidatus Acetothermia bacterium]|nr:type II toxin-antitoxin system HicB family antitoxin [Candidatus Acetothermia bacterium]MCI2432075.1 type II toxin-antitoxin system HicB family antitoxin [Candidatus Acetothermia bacterium]MCI2435882.1 type II toxin-antitoxin system HicB family antitoxin [Candidatus Acetothermia bacterium]
MKKCKAGDHRKLRVRFEKGYDGFIVAECLDIPGCMSQGRTLAEARRNIQQAIQECLEVILQDALKAIRARAPANAPLSKKRFSLFRR